MSKSILSVRGLSKKYYTGKRTAPSLYETFSGIFRKEQQEDTHAFWALDNIDFDLYEGETLGIIGKNGAGKSTLLKILSRITPPTRGEVTIRGRLSSLLEVGTGFHPELTGAENIYLNGSILGMTRGEIKSKFDEIVAFSGVEKFIGTPVKRYSSGMYVRLAFAVAAHLEPEILVVDEVLAVGDAEFQRKCIGKMNEVAGQGRTVLFVSHNLGQVKSLCRKGLLLEKGKQLMIGSVHEAVGRYVTTEKTGTHIDLTQLPAYFKSPGFRFLSLSFGESLHQLKRGYTLGIEVKVEVNEPLNELLIGLPISNENGTLLEFKSSVGAPDFSPEPGIYTLSGTLEIPLKEGLYNLNLGAACTRGTLEYYPAITSLEVLPAEETTEEWKRETGYFRAASSWQWNKEKDV